MLYFCTLFDSNYLSRGLVTYESLMSSTVQKDSFGEGGAHLYVFAFDDKCYDVLISMNLPNLTVISLKEFEDEKLLKVKKTRSKGEYCWTCTGSTILYALKKYNLPHCTYIDADMYFFNNPKVLIDEKPDDCSVILTEHRYTPQYDKSKLAGRYCVQFMYFENKPSSLEALNWWRERCIEWCYNRLEDGKFGDQKYLDDWTERFTGIHVMKHLGGGMAPWNIQQYYFDFNTNNSLIGYLKDSFSRLYFNKAWLIAGGRSEFSPIFFHFHGVKIYTNGAAIYAPKMYILTPSVRSIFYESYVQKLLEAQERLKSYDPSFDTIGFGTSKQYNEDRNKGWGGFVKTNILNKFFGTKLN